MGSSQICVSVEEMEELLKLREKAFEKSVFHSAHVSYPLVVSKRAEKEKDPAKGSVLSKFMVSKSELGHFPSQSTEEDRRPKQLSERIEDTMISHQLEIEDLLLAREAADQEGIEKSDIVQGYLEFLEGLNKRRSTHLRALAAKARTVKLTDEIMKSKLPKDLISMDQLPPTITLPGSVEPSKKAFARRMRYMQIEQMASEAAETAQKLFSINIEDVDSALSAVSKRLKNRPLLYDQVFRSANPLDTEMADKMAKLEAQDDRIRSVDAATQAAAPRTCDPDDSDYDDELGYTSFNVVRDLETILFGGPMEDGDLPLRGAERRKVEEAELFVQLPSLRRTGAVEDPQSPARMTARKLASSMGGSQLLQGVSEFRPVSPVHDHANATLTSTFSRAGAGGNDFNQTKESAYENAESLFYSTFTPAIPASSASATSNIRRTAPPARPKFSEEPTPAPVPRPTPLAPTNPLAPPSQPAAPTTSAASRAVDNILSSGGPELTLPPPSQGSVLGPELESLMAERQRMRRESLGGLAGGGSGTGEGGMKVARVKATKQVSF